MEEKERYEIIYHNYVNPVDNWMSFFDNETNRDFDNDADFEAIVEILNEQDKRIKELEQEYEKLFAEAYFKSCEYCQNKIVKENVVIKEESNKLFEENQQLKQQLHDLPKKIVEEIKKVSDTATLGSGEVYDYTITAKNLDTILKKYGDKQ